MFTEDQLKKEVANAFRSADESPHKYIRIAWTPNAKVAIIKGEKFPLSQVLLVYVDQDVPAPTIIKSGEGNFHFLCKPKKHMAWLMSKDKNPVSYHYLDIKNAPAKKPSVAMADPCEEPPRTDVLICVAETEEKSTVVIAFVNGTYILRTLDEGNSATLYGVIQTLADICSLNRKEDNQHEQEEKEVQPLGI